jgi:hypothetical protein
MLLRNTDVIYKITINYNPQKTTKSEIPPHPPFNTENFIV